MISLEAVIFYLFLLDSIGANLFAWSDGKKWYQKHFRVFSRYFPLAKGWTAVYLILVLVIGMLMKKQGLL